MVEGTPKLEAGLATYQRLLPTLGGDEGRFALISGNDLLGIFDTYRDSLENGAKGLDPFLVKRIRAAC